MVLGGIRIEAEADLGDLRLRRQPAAREAVDAQHGAGPGHLLELRGHFVFVVGQGVDLVLGERRREVVGDVLVGLVARDLHLLDVAGDRELDFAALLAAAADGDVGNLLGLEADRLDLGDVLARRQAVDRRLALLVGGGALRLGAARRVGGHHRHRRPDDGGPGLIEHDHLDAAGVRIRLLLRGGPGGGGRGLRLRILRRGRGGRDGGQARGKGGDGEQPREPGTGNHDQLLVLRLNWSSSSFGLALAFFSSHSSVGLSPVCIVK